MACPWRNSASLSSKLKTLAIQMLPPTLRDLYINAPSQQTDVPPLHFPEVPNSLPELLALGISPHHANSLYAQYTDAIAKLDRTLAEHYYDDTPKLKDNAAPFATRSIYIQAFQNHLCTVRTQAVATLWTTLLSCAQRLVQEVQVNPLATSTTSSTSCAPSNKRKRQGRPHPFTPEQTFALNALFARDDQYSSEEKEYIAQKLNLTRDQVNRWFCNARARKNVGARPTSRGGSPDSIRTVSSDLTIIESNRSEPVRSTPELTLPTSGIQYPSHGLTNPTDNPSSTFDIINPPLDVNIISAPESTNLTSNVDPLDDYMNYVAYLELEQIPADLAKNALVAQQQITNPNSTSENVHINIPTRSSSSIESDAVPRNAPWDLSIHPGPETWSHDSIASFNDPLFDSFNLNPIPPLSLPSSTALAPLPSNDLFPGLDLAEWGVPS